METNGFQNNTFLHMIVHSEYGKEFWSLNSAKAKEYDGLYSQVVCLQEMSLEVSPYLYFPIYEEQCKCWTLLTHYYKEVHKLVLHYVPPRSE